ncbi:MAG: hypothetical protein MSH11_06425 [Ruminococcus sp.]|nr:hypothetical protein [Ruminococcus sp.]
MPSDVANFIILRKHQKETKRKTAGTNGLDEIKDLPKAPSEEGAVTPCVTGGVKKQSIYLGMSLDIKV